MTYSVEWGPDPSLVINPDCDGAAEKIDAVFVADLFAPGGTAPGDLDPKIDQVVVRPIAGDVRPEAIQMLMNRAGVTIR